MARKEQREPKRRYQVFVSSTYEDLKEDRQAAVEAILTAGHIPAGMELFTSGDLSQMAVIRRWIDESDIFMLILGGRYGSIEATSGKSYTELEFEHAVATKTPFFSVVIEEDALEQRVKDRGRKVIEQDNVVEFRAFRDQVMSRMCRFFSSSDQVKLAVHESLHALIQENDLVGWIPGDAAMVRTVVSTQLAKLAKENAALQKKVEAQQAVVRLSNGLTVDEMLKVLDGVNVTLSPLVHELDKDVEVTLARATLMLSRFLASGVSNAAAAHKSERYVYGTVASPLAGYGLMEFGKLPAKFSFQRLVLSADGRKVIARLNLRRLQEGSE